jgi:hypothetical protein
MAITGFGVTELNLIGSSGTPNIESPNNINLNAVTVAISTNATVGGTATFGGDVDIADTIYHTGDSNTKIRFPANDTISLHTGGNEQFLIDSSGNSTFSGNVGLSTDLNVTGIATAASFKSSTTTGDGSDIAFATKYYITANGSSAYRFAGAGVLNSTDDPTLYFQRGSTYILENSTGGSHPFALRVSDGGSAYAPGGQFLTGSTTGTQVLTVPMDAPVSIVYQCTAHAGMVGIISFR